MRPKTYIADDHDIDHSQIDSDALWVIKKLSEAGYTAYLVGGSVRDLLIGISPKDYDISTSARPEEIKKVFRRQCLLIGRRFRLAHIRFGHKIFEVSTFRSGDNESDLIIRDNQWGSEEEDVIRRDFTVNGLFYDPPNHTIIDYVGGWEDIHKKTLRSIGDPKIRFKQDPVRMLRLLKFRARLGFEIDPLAKEALLECKNELIKSSPARILEEFFRMLESGASNRFLQMLNSSGILKLIFPLLAEFLKQDCGEQIYNNLSIADQINCRASRPLDRSILLSCLLYPIVERGVETQFLEKDLKPNLGDIMMVATSLIRGIVTSSFSHFPKRISATTLYIITSQYRFTPASGKRHYRTKMFQNKEFPLALMFLKIRALANKEFLEPYTTWDKIYRHHRSQSEHHRKHHPPPQKKTS